MPSVSHILQGLERIARGWWPLAVLWHAGLATFLVWQWWSPGFTRRAAGLLLAAPLVSVSALAFWQGNPFNGLVFALLALGAIGIALRADTRRAAFTRDGFAAVGAVLVAFASIYPHFLAPGPAIRYLYAAPLGLIPCPTLAGIVGITLMMGGLGMRTWTILFGAAGLFYGAFGAIRLGVNLDWVLFAGASFLIARSTRMRATDD